MSDTDSSEKDLQKFMSTLTKLSSDFEKDINPMDKCIQTAKQFKGFK